MKKRMYSSISFCTGFSPVTCKSMNSSALIQPLMASIAALSVGMAANMIGVAKQIIIFDDSGSATVMFNPEIVKCSGTYEAEEGCLSLTGTRKAKRWRSIKVLYQNEQFQTRLKTYTGFTAQIIQHEIDHLGGVLI